MDAWSPPVCVWLCFCVHAHKAEDFYVTLCRCNWYTFSLFSLLPLELVNFISQSCNVTIEAVLKLQDDIIIDFSWDLCNVFIMSHLRPIYQELKVKLWSKNRFVSYSLSLINLIQLSHASNPSSLRVSVSPSRRFPQLFHTPTPLGLIQYFPTSISRESLLTNSNCFCTWVGLVSWGWKNWVGWRWGTRPGCSRRRCRGSIAVSTRVQGESRGQGAGQVEYVLRRALGNAVTQGVD